MTQKISTALVYGKLFAGGASQQIRNFPTKTYQIKLDPSESYEWTIDTAYDYYMVEKLSSESLIVSLEPYVAPSASGTGGIISDNQIMVDPTGIDIEKLNDDFGVTTLYFKNTDSTNPMQILLSGYTFNGFLEVETGKQIITDDGDEIITDTEDNILTDGEEEATNEQSI